MRCYEGMLPDGYAVPRKNASTPTGAPTECRTCHGAPQDRGAGLRRAIQRDTFFSLRASPGGQSRLLVTRRNWIAQAQTEVTPVEGGAIAAVLRQIVCDHCEPWRNRRDSMGNVPSFAQAEKPRLKARLSAIGSGLGSLELPKQLGFESTYRARPSGLPVKCRPSVYNLAQRHTDAHSWWSTWTSCIRTFGFDMSTS